MESDEHPGATTFHGQWREENRPTIAVDEFTALSEHASGHSIMVLSSPLRTFDLTKGRIELTLLAVTRFGLELR